MNQPSTLRHSKSHREKAEAGKRLTPYEILERYARGSRLPGRATAREFVQDRAMPFNFDPINFGVVSFGQPGWDKA